MGADRALGANFGITDDGDDDDYGYPVPVPHESFVHGKDINNRDHKAPTKMHNGRGQ